MTWRTMGAALLAVALGATACGGSDSSEDDARAALEDFGVNIDGDIPGFDVGDLEDLDDLEVSVEDGEVQINGQSVEELTEDLEESISGFSQGASRGSVTIDGVTWEIDGDLCYLDQGDLGISGEGKGSDGSVAWIDVSRTYDTREELQEFFDDDFIDFLTGGGDVVDYVTVDVAVGQTGIYGSAPDGMPDWSSTSEFDVNELDYQVDGSSIAGSGTIQDDNAAEYGVQVPFVFEASCS